MYLLHINLALAYYAEQTQPGTTIVKNGNAAYVGIPSIPIGLWWAIITMCTVGKVTFKTTTCAS